MPIALITGAGCRIGKYLAQGLLAKGYQVFLHAHNSYNDLLTWSSHHELSSHIISSIKADLSHEDGVAYLVNNIKATSLSLDLIVHNASLYYPASFADINRHQLTEILSLNVMAPYFITQGLLGLMTKSSSIINIVDAMWFRARKHYTHYSISKAALAMLTRSLAIELAPHIRVNAISPGAIIFSKYETKKSIAKLTKRIPQQRHGHPNDILEAILYLSKASYVTGQILSVDGGRESMY